MEQLIIRVNIILSGLYESGRGSSRTDRVHFILKLRYEKWFHIRNIKYTGLVYEVSEYRGCIRPIYRYKTDSSHSNDVAVLRLARKVKFNVFIQPICLPQPELRFPTAQDVDGFSCYVTGWDRQTYINCFLKIWSVCRSRFIGWGYLNENSTEHASILQEVQVPLQEMLICHMDIL